MKIKELTLKGEGYIMNKIPINLLGHTKIISKKKGNRIIAGYANLAVVDSQNQLIPTEVLKVGIETLMGDLSYANLMLFHKNIQIGKILPEWGKFNTHVDDKGLFIVAEIRSDTEIANDIWKQIVNGEINGFSIGCEVIDAHKKCDVEGKNCIEILDRINIFEVSLTNFPANEMSGFVVVSKNKYDEGNLDLSEYENVCDECNINRDIMSKKKAKSEVEDKEPSETEDETKSEEVELTDSEKIEKLERDIFNIQALLAKLTAEEKSEKEEEVPKEEEKSEEKPKEEEKVEEKTEKEPEVKEEEKSDDDLKAKVDSIAQEMSNLTEKLAGLFAEKTEEKKIEDLKKENEELRLAVKARDDEIVARDKKIEILTKSKEETKESKTLQEPDDDKTIEIEPDDPFTFKNGEMYKRF